MDPITLAIGTYGVITTNRCKVCRKVKLFSKWTTWNCCKVPQCSECAAATEAAKTCQKCDSRVQ